MLDLNKLKSGLNGKGYILRKEEYFNSAVLIPLIKIEDEYHLIFEKRGMNIRQPGEICFPGGEFNKKNDTDFEETAIRETAEEIGIGKDDIQILGQLGVLIGPMGVTVDAFVGVVNVPDIFALKIDTYEVEKIFTVPVSYFLSNEPELYHVKLEVHPFFMNEKGERVDLLPVKELKLPAKYSTPWGGRKRNVLVYKTGGEVIWGITAALVHELVTILKEN